MDGIIELIASQPGMNWGLGIPQYFFFTGISAAAFLVSALNYVFGFKEFKPIAGLSLIVALTVLLAAPLNLISELLQPGRFYSLFLRIHETSPMSWGVFLLTLYPALIALEIVFVFRSEFAHRAQKAAGWRRSVYRIAALGSTTISPHTEARDHRMSRVLGALGIPAALAVHGYTGYILGVVRARPLWHTPLMPLIFLVSAMVSGLALMLLLGWWLARNGNHRPRWGMLDKLAVLLGWTIIGDLTLRLLWYSIGFFYSYGSYQDVVNYLFRERFFESLVLEIGIALILPAFVMLVPALRRIRPLFLTSALITVAGVWLFRYDTVIGGQEIPKVNTGFLQYTPTPEVVGTVLANWAFWMFLLIIFSWVIPWSSSAPEGGYDAGLAA